MLFDSMRPGWFEPSGPCDDGRQLSSRQSLGLRVCGPDDEDRDRAEDYIRRTFHRTHGASIRSFMPVLLTLHDALGQLSGVVGYRPALRGNLFLERYLDRPVEAAIAAQAGTQVQRHTVVEIGNLACLNSETARQLIQMLPLHLMREDYLWVTFTGTRTVRGILRMFNAPLLELCRADAACVAGMDDDWGRYYDSDPRVIAGYLPNAVTSVSPAQRKHED